MGAEDPAGRGTSKDGAGEGRPAPVALYKTEGIVLRVQPFAEADRLATLLTPDLGRVRAIAKGAQKARGALGAAVQPFVQARFVLWQGRELDGISQADIVAPHRRLAADLGLLSAAAYCCELADAFSAEGQESPLAYARLANALDLLEGLAGDGGVAEAPDASLAPRQAVVLRWFELQLLRDAGVQPELHQCAGCGRAMPEPEGRNRLSPSIGGLLCPECAPQDPEAPWVSRNAVRGLRFMAGADPRKVPGIRVGPATMSDMDVALRRHIGAVLQRPLKSRALLDTLS